MPAPEPARASVQAAPEDRERATSLASRVSASCDLRSCLRRLRTAERLVRARGSAEAHHVWPKGLMLPTPVTSVVDRQNGFALGRRTDPTRGGYPTSPGVPLMPNGARGDGDVSFLASVLFHDANLRFPHLCQHTCDTHEDGERNADEWRSAKLRNRWSAKRERRYEHTKEGLRIFELCEDLEPDRFRPVLRVAPRSGKAVHQLKPVPAQALLTR